MFPPAAKAVGKISGFTVTVKLWVALSFGFPLSVTSKEIELAVLAWLTDGRHEKAPEFVLKVALAGALNRLNVSVCGG